MPYTIHHHHATAVNHHAPPKHHPKLLSILLKFIIMSLILSTFLIFLGLAAIIIILLGLCSFLHRRRRQPPPTTVNSLLDIQTNLPVFHYSGAATVDCSICLEGFKDGESCRTLPVCDHVFHANCVDKWLVKVANCPVCRSPVRLEVGRRSSLGVNDDEYKFLWAIGVGR